jgi:hypothetical protein
MEMMRKYDWHSFAGMGMLATARLVNDSSFVLGSGSMGVVLAGTLGIPSLRVHDPLWGEEDFTLWGNVGEKQMNYYPEGAIDVAGVKDFVGANCLKPLEVRLTV